MYNFRLLTLFPFASSEMVQTIVGNMCAKGFRKRIITNYFIFSYDPRKLNKHQKKMPPVLSLRQMLFFLSESYSREEIMPFQKKECLNPASGSKVIQF